MSHFSLEITQFVPSFARGEMRRVGIRTRPTEIDGKAAAAVQASFPGLRRRHAAAPEAAGGENNEKRYVRFRPEQRRSCTKRRRGRERGEEKAGEKEKNDDGERGGSAVLTDGRDGKITAAWKSFGGGTKRGRSCL